MSRVLLLEVLIYEGFIGGLLMILMFGPCCF